MPVPVPFLGLTGGKGKVREEVLLAAEIALPCPSGKVLNGIAAVLQIGRIPAVEAQDELDGVGPPDDLLWNRQGQSARVPDLVGVVGRPDRRRRR